MMPSNTAEVTSTVRVIGSESGGKLSPKIDGTYIYPPPGGGTAGVNCDSVHPINTQAKWSVAIQELYGSSMTDLLPYGDASDHPCHWHRFTFGDPPIEIPLWGLQKQSDGTYKMADIALKDFRLALSDIEQCLQPVTIILIEMFKCSFHTTPILWVVAFQSRIFDLIIAPTQFRLRQLAVIYINIRKY